MRELIVKELYDHEWLMQANLNNALVHHIIVGARYDNMPVEDFYRNLSKELYDEVVRLQSSLINKIQNETGRFTS